MTCKNGQMLAASIQHLTTQKIIQYLANKQVIQHLAM